VSIQIYKMGPSGAAREHREERDRQWFNKLLGVPGYSPQVVPDQLNKIEVNKIVMEHTIIGFRFTYEGNLDYPVSVGNINYDDQKYEIDLSGGNTHLKSIRGTFWDVITKLEFGISRSGELTYEDVLPTPTESPDHIEHRQFEYTAPEDQAILCIWGSWLQDQALDSIGVYVGKI